MSQARTILATFLLLIVASIIDGKGVIYSWGEAGSALGYDVEVSAQKPVRVHVPEALDFVDVAVSSHAVGVTSNGEVYAWGPNEKGQLAVGPSEYGESYVATPKRVVPGAMDGYHIKKAFVCASFTILLSTNGTVFGFGKSPDYELGVAQDVVSEPILIPAPVPIVDVAVATGYALYLAADGDVYITGNTFCGGRSLMKRMRKIATVSNISAIAAGFQFIVFLNSTGSLLTCGQGDMGQLGTGGFYDSTFPVAANMTELQGKTIKSIAASRTASVLFTTDGSIYYWGSFTGNTIAATIPTQLLFDEEPIADVNLGYSGCLVAITTNSTLYGTGICLKDQLFDADSRAFGKLTRSPMEMNGSVTKVAVGVSATVAIAGQKVFAFGDRSNGIIGDGMVDGSIVPRKIPFSGSVKKIVSAAYTAYFLTTNWEAYGFGLNSKQNVAGSTDINVINPVKLPLDTAIVDIAIGDFHGLALTRSGDIYCWGDNVYGQCATGDTRPTVPVTRVAHKTLQERTLVGVFASSEYSMVMDLDGVVLAWGNNYNGILGQGDFDETDPQPAISTIPLIVKLPSFKGQIIQLSTHSSQVIAITNENELVGWGSQANPDTTSYDPSIISNTSLPTSSIRSVVAGASQSYGIDHAGTLYLWGTDTAETGKQDSPVWTPFTGVIPPVKTVYPGDRAVFAIANNTVYAWGNSFLGDGKLPHKASKPVKVLLSATPISMASGITNSYAVIEENEYECFGLPESDPLVCNGAGTCSAKDVCICRSGFYGDSCQLHIATSFEVDCTGTMMTLATPAIANFTILDLNLLLVNASAIIPNFGQQATAFFSNSGATVIQFGSGKVYLPETVEVSVNYLLSQIERTSYTSYGSIIVTIDRSKVLATNVTLNAPQTIALCQDLKLDAVIDCGDSKATITFASNVTSVESYLKEFASLGGATIPREQIPTGAISITLTVEPRLGESVSQTIVVSKQSVEVPEFVLPTAPVEATRNTEFTFEPAIKYDCMLNQFPTLGFVQVSGPNVSFVFEQNKLTVPSRGFSEYGSYTFNLTINNEVTSAQLTVLVTARNLTTAVSAPNTAFRGEAIKLLASVIDPNQEDGGAICQWTVKEISNDTVVGFNSTETSHCEYLSIPPNYIQAGNYLATLVASKDGRSSASDVLIHVEDATIPAVTIAPIARFVSANSVLVLKAINIKSASANPRLQWTCDNLILNETSTSTKTNSPILVIKQNVLTAGQTYTFTVTIIDENRSSFSQVTTTVSDAPAGGDCSVMPTSGKAGSTFFTLSCNGWQSTAGPLSYSVAFFEKQSNRHIELVVGSSSPVFSLPLPAGYTDNSLLLRFTVSDSMNNQITVTRYATVSEPQSLSNPKNFTDDAVSLLQKLAAQGSTAAARSIALFSIQMVSSVHSDVALKERLFASAVGLFNTSNLQQYSIQSIQQTAHVMEYLSNTQYAEVPTMLLLRNLRDLISSRDDTVTYSVLSSLDNIKRTSAPIASAVLQITENALETLAMNKLAGEFQTSVSYRSWTALVNKYFTTELKRTGYKSDVVAIGSNSLASAKLGEDVSIVDGVFNENPFALRTSKEANLTGAIAFAMVKSNNAPVSDLPVSYLFSGNFDTAKYNFECNQWDEKLLSWQQGCTLGASSFTAMECICPSGAYVAVSYEEKQEKKEDGRNYTPYIVLGVIGVLAIIAISALVLGIVSALMLHRMKKKSQHKLLKDIEVPLVAQ